MPQSSKKTSTPGGGSRADQVRSAVDSALQAAGAQIGRDRAMDLADELASAAQRVREALEELRPPTADDLKKFARRLTAIERRLVDLESAASAVASRRPGARAARSAAAAKRPAAAAKPKTATKPKAAAKPKTAAAKPKGAKPKAKPAARKPASGRTTAPRSAGGAGR